MSIILYNVYREKGRLKYLETLQDILKSRREYLKLSFRDAADLIGISHSYLHNLEKGIDPRTKVPIKPGPETLRLISEAYKIDFNHLMKIEGYLPEEKKSDSLVMMDKFQHDLLHRMRLDGYNFNEMTEEEIKELVDKVIKILDISKSN